MVAARHGAIVTEEQDEHVCSRPVGEDVTRPETVAKAAHRRGQPAGREPLSVDQVHPQSCAR